MIWTGREETSWGFQSGEQIVPGLLALERLGGSEYEVYLAKDEQLGREVVTKLVRPHMVEESYPVRGLLREADVLQCLSHPHIVKLIRPDVGAPKPHLVLGHCPGHSIAEIVVADGPIPMPEALRIALSVTEIVNYLAQSGIVHLDIKPQNLIIGPEVTLIDFGIARSIEEARSLKSPTGTDAYMAPEQCGPNEGTVGPAADIWGVGGTLLFMVTGRPPFPRLREAPTGRAGRWPQLTSNAGIPEELGVELVSLLRGCLARQPQDRPPISEVLVRLKKIV